MKDLFTNILYCRTLWCSCNSEKYFL